MLLISNTFLKTFKFKNLLNIDKSTIIKLKNKSRKSQNKKNIILKVDKTTIRFTKRNFSNFEIVKTKIDNKIKRVRKNEQIKKNITTRIEKNLTIRVEKNTTTRTTTQIKKNTTTQIKKNTTT